MSNTTHTIEAFAMIQYKKHQIFYTQKLDKDITAIANYYKRKVKTERFAAMDCLKHKEINLLTKVTLLN